MTMSVYITLHKKNDRGLCGNFRMPARISHASKIILNMRQCGLERTTSIEVRDTQCDFARGNGTTDGNFLLKVVAEAYDEGKHPLHLVFVEYEKAFDSVNHTLLFPKLQGFGIDEDVMRLLEGLYINSKYQLCWKGWMTDKFETPVGVMLMKRLNA